MRNFKIVKWITICLLLTVIEVSHPTAFATGNSGLKPCILGRLGSRLTVLPEPDLGRIRIMPLGHHLPEFNGLQVRWSSKDNTVAFPPDHGNLPPQLTHEMSPTAVSYTFPLDDNGLTMEYKLVSPFCPDLPEWRSAPIMFLEITITNTSDTPVDAALECNVIETGETIRTASQSTEGALYRWRFHLDQTRCSSSNVSDYLAPELVAKAELQKKSEQFKTKGNGDFAVCGLKNHGWKFSRGTLKTELSVAAGKSTLKRLVIAFQTRSPVLKVDGHPRSIWTANPDRDVLGTARAALDNFAVIMDSNNRFETDLIHGFETEYQVNLLSLGFQSFLTNTWLFNDENGAPRYSEWEGRPLFHATLDVVFNTSPFHLKYTPDLLINMLKHRPRYNHKNHLSHDIGKGLVIGKNSYPVKMIVEEDTNFILLHYMVARTTGKTDLAAEHASLLVKLAESLMDADTDGDGLPNKGTINTFDDAPPSINSSENQLYLGIKTAAALHAVRELSRDVPGLRGQHEQRIDAAIQTIIDTVNHSWEGDHYPINLEPESSRRKFVVMPFNTRENANPSPMAGDSSHGYSNYLAHGLVPLLMFCQQEPAKWFPNMATHLTTAHNKTNTEYGDAHRDGVENVWISQNMWRDLAAAYLGAELDFKKLHRQYWQNQMACFRRSREKADTVLMSPWTGFCDSPESSFLTWYSRGIPIVLLPQALHHMPVAGTVAP